MDQHPPFYYTLLHLWIGLFGPLEGAVRTLSALASTLTVPVFYLGCRRLLDRPTAVIAVGILAVSPFHVQFAQETRMYALLTLEVACVIYFLARLVTTQVPRGRDWVGLAFAQGPGHVDPQCGSCLSACGVERSSWDDLPAISFRGRAGDRQLAGKDNSGRCWGENASQANAPNVAAAEQQGMESPAKAGADADSFWINWVRFQGLAVLLWLPWAVPFIIQVIDVGSGFWLPPPWPNLVLDTFRNFHFAFLPSDLPWRPVWMWGYSALAVVGLVGLLVRRGSLSTGLRWPRLGGQGNRQVSAEKSASSADSDRAAVLIVCLFAVPHIVALLVSLRSPIYAERPLIWTTLPYFVLVAAGIRVLGGPLQRGLLEITDLRRRASVAALVSTVRMSTQLLILLVILVLSGLSLNGYYFWFQKEGWDEAASYIAEQVEPADMIVFNATWVQIPFAYYYERYDLDTELKGFPVDLFDRGELEPRMEEGDVARIKELLDGREQVWLVYSHNWYSDPDGIIPRELGKIFVETELAEFTGIQIMRFAGKR